MVVAAKLKAFLDEHKVPYHVLKHHEAYTAMEIAEALHVPGKELAKVVMVRAGEKLVMAVLPANFSVDLAKFAQEVGQEIVYTATEEQFRDTFPDCEVGAMPPFGNLYGVPVYMDRALAEDDTIFFEAGNHHEAMRLKFKDFERLVRPKIGDFAVR